MKIVKVSNNCEAEGHVHREREHQDRYLVLSLSLNDMFYY